MGRSGWAGRQAVMGDEMITEAATIECGVAERTRVEVAMGAGELVIAGGAGALLEAEFSYNVPAWRPEVSYVVRDGHGLLRVRQPHGDSAGVRNARQRWELRLADGLPIDLHITIGAVTGNLTLGDLTLTGLRVETGAGSLVIDLSMACRPFEAAIEGGVINTTLRLPAAIGAYVAVRAPIATVNGGGLRREAGGYANGRYDPAGAAVRIGIKGGVANVILAGR